MNNLKTCKSCILKFFITSKKNCIKEVKLFFLFLSERGEDTGFEHLPIPQLASMLREFYASLRTKDGKQNSKMAYVNIHSALN